MKLECDRLDIDGLFETDICPVDISSSALWLSTYCKCYAMSEYGTFLSLRNEWRCKE